MAFQAAFVLRDVGGGDGNDEWFHGVSSMWMRRVRRDYLQFTDRRKTATSQGNWGEHARKA